MSREELSPSASLHHRLKNCGIKKAKCLVSYSEGRVHILCVPVVVKHETYV